MRAGKHVGVGALQKLHGGSVNRGNRPSHHRDGSGSGMYTSSIRTTAFPVDSHVLCNFFA